MAEFWLEKRYHSLDYDMKKKYKEKVYRITLDGGMSCPNRDGTLGSRGCLFCSAAGSGDFAGDRTLTITQQLAEGKKAVKAKRPVQRFIAYFQAFSNTYAPVDYLRKIFYEAISDPEVVILSIATRPDCLNAEILTLLEELNHIKPVWVELGLQTVHEETAKYIRRGFLLSTFEEAVSGLRIRNITVIVHTILYLPGESQERMKQTIQYLNQQNIQGVKLHLLHVLYGTDLGSLYQNMPFYLPDMMEYVTFLSELICMLRPDITIHRMTGDGPKDLLLAPKWTANKRMVMNAINRNLAENDLWQGKFFLNSFF